MAFWTQYFLQWCLIKYFSTFSDNIIFLYLDSPEGETTIYPELKEQEAFAHLLFIHSFIAHSFSFKFSKADRLCLHSAPVYYLCKIIVIVYEWASVSGWIVPKQCSRPIVYWILHLVQSECARLQVKPQLRDFVCVCCVWRHSATGIMCKTDLFHKVKYGTYR